MNRNELLARVAAILSTLNETNGSPEGLLYVACGMDMNDWQVIRSILTGNPKPLVNIRGYYVTLTEEGKEMALKIDAIIKEK